MMSTGEESGMSCAQKVGVLDVSETARLIGLAGLSGKAQDAVGYSQAEGFGSET
ncbi:hypothetical protein JTE88_06675 [Arcanobacterium phocisimile]|uniref:Uncharacterized protein n=1 Tax=Arcanobacterium phocisimile TaxID=1302235 RepID=A0ABX7IFM2_9ACTO|nr:hypothetical protein [Arcanobacterium phocisimile]QRV01771.1 hypothetical protein JTE88_06675 [Arcanobacterium phocisimile]